MTTPREFPALEFDPAPGVVGQIQAVVVDLSAVAKDLGEARAAMLSAGQAGGIWEGEAAEAFRDKVGEVPEYLDKANRSMGDAAKVLDGWAQDLTSMQRTAAEYEARAQTARQALRSAEANPDLGLAGRTFDNDQALQQAKARYDAAAGQLRTARGELEAIIEDAGRLLRQHRDLADRVAAALLRAKDEAPAEPGFFSRLGELIGDIGEGIAQLAKDTWQFVEDHADTIAKIGDVLSAVGTVLSVVAVATSWIPGVNTVTAAAAVGVSAAAMGTHLLAKAAGADVSWTKIGFDAIGMIPGGGAAKGALGAAKVLPKALKSGQAAAKFAEGSKVAAGAAAAAKTISRAGVQKIGANANLVNKGINGINAVGSRIGIGSIDNLAVRSWETGGKTIFGGAQVAHSAQSGAAVVAGATVETLKQGALTAGKWEAQPYLTQAENSVKDKAGDVMQGFQKAVTGR